MKVSQTLVKDLFDHALEIPSPEERQRFLQLSCKSDTELKNKVEELLEAYFQAGDFLEPVVPATILTAPQSQALDTKIGPYKLREQIGEGGFGIVYVAEQREPIQRKVALKLIKPGMDSKEIIARFEAERQALALMDHPHIARVIDAGTTDDGRPYFVMELVNGLPITNFCNQQQLTTEERLKLFVGVCRAVQHAHQKGIIHRDIKPSNVLVTLHDGKPVVKVIDFGIAKALSQRLTENTVYTAMGQMVGTPAYMSPEQAEMSGLDVDTRSDIYSLGVLLYELLTGTTPFDRESLKNAGYAEVQRIIRETEPVKPSARLSTLKNEERSTIIDQRRVDLRKLEQTLRGDLDWVVMKSLEKDRERRYHSAADFADDIELYLNQRPVLAGPPSSLYRLRKYVRRHKLALTAVALVLMSMMAGTGFSVWYAIQAGEAREQAVTSESLANQRLVLLEEEQQKLKQEKRKSERNFTLAKEAVAKLIDEVASRNLIAFPELSDFRTTLLKTADKFYTDLINESEEDFDLFVDRGRVMRLLNLHSNALQDFLTAESMNPKSRRVHVALSEFYRNTSDLELRNPHEALRHAKEAVRLQPSYAPCWHVLAWAHYAVGDRNDAVDAMYRAVEFSTHEGDKEYQLGCALEFERRYAEAAEHYQRAGELLAHEKPNCLLREGTCLFLDKQYKESLKRFNQSIELNHFSHLAHYHRAEVNFALGNYSSTISDCEQALELAPFMESKITPYLLKSYLKLGHWGQATSLIDDQLGNVTQSRLLLDIQVNNLIDGSENEDLIAARDHFRLRIEKHLRSKGEFAELVSFHESLGQHQEAIAACTDMIEFAGDTATAEMYQLRARVKRHGLDQPEAALADYEKARELAPKSWKPIAGIALCWNDLGQPQQAFTFYKESIIADPQPEFYRWGRLAAFAGDCDDFPTALSFFKKHSTLRPDKWQEWRFIAALHLLAGDITGYQETCESMQLETYSNGEPDAHQIDPFICLVAPDAVRDYTSVIKVAQVDAQDKPLPPWTGALGGILMRAGKFNEAREVLAAAIENTQAATAHRVRNGYLLAITYQQLGETANAEHTFEKTRQLLESKLESQKDNHWQWYQKPLMELLDAEAELLIRTDATGDSQFESNVQ